MTDAHGNSTTGTILVDIIDDVPTAHVDSGNVAEGALLTVAAAWGSGRTTLPARTALRPAAGLSGFARRAAT